MFPVYVSKFLAEGITVELREIEVEWAGWSGTERFEFVNAYKDKPDVSAEDERILTFLMDHGNELTWVSIGRLLSKHSDRDRVLGFLRKRLEAVSTEPKATFIQALRNIGGTESLSILGEFYDTTRPQVAVHRQEADPTLVIDFAHCCSALSQLKGEPAYLQEVQEFANDEREIVRLPIANILGHQDEID